MPDGSNMRNCFDRIIYSLAIVHGPILVTLTFRALKDANGVVWVAFQYSRDQLKNGIHHSMHVNTVLN